MEHTILFKIPQLITVECFEQIQYTIVIYLFFVHTLLVLNSKKNDTRKWYYSPQFK